MEHTTKLAGRKESSLDLKSQVDSLLERVATVGKMAECINGLLEPNYCFASRAVRSGLGPCLTQIRHSLLPELAPNRVIGQALYLLDEAISIGRFDGLN